MIRIPKDIENELKKNDKYKDINISELINELFTLILSKTFNDGGCTIRLFGSFFSFKTFSKRHGKDVVRFKFQPSKMLKLNIRNDQYLLDKVPDAKENVSYDESRITKESQQRRDENKNLKECGIFNKAREKTKRNIQIEDIFKSE